MNCNHPDPKLTSSGNIQLSGGEISDNIREDLYCPICDRILTPEEIKMKYQFTKKKLKSLENHAQGLIKELNEMIISGIPPVHNDNIEDWAFYFFTIGMPFYIGWSWVAERILQEKSLLDQFNNKFQFDLESGLKEGIKLYSDESEILEEIP